MNPTPPPPDERPPDAPAARIDPGLAIEAALAIALSTLLCWNAWPWIVDQQAQGASRTTSAVVTAVLLYGLAWPAIAAALMGAQRHAFSSLTDRSRRLLAGTLLVLVLLALIGSPLASGG